jgi:membrane-anchored protein YejM (alkaline phosphatase superfamily)
MDLGVRRRAHELFRSFRNERLALTTVMRLLIVSRQSPAITSFGSQSTGSRFTCHVSGGSKNEPFGRFFG